MPEDILTDAKAKQIKAVQYVRDRFNRGRGKFMDTVNPELQSLIDLSSQSPRRPHGHKMPENELKLN